MLKVALELQYTNLDLRGKIIQKVKFVSVSQNSNLSLKLDYTHQNEFGGMLVFQNIIPEVHKPNFHAKQSNELTLKTHFLTKARYEILRPLLDS